MTNTTVSASPTALFRYADVGTQLNQQLAHEASKLAHSLRRFSAGCTEYRIGVDDQLADHLRSIIRRGGASDSWVREVGRGFMAADSSTLGRAWRSRPARTVQVRRAMAWQAVKQVRKRQRGGLWNSLRRGLGGIGRLIGGVGRSVARAAGGIFRRIGSIFGKIGGWFSSALKLAKKLLQRLTGAFDGLLSKLGFAGKLIKGVVKAFGPLAFKAVLGVLGVATGGVVPILASVAFAALTSSKGAGFLGLLKAIPGVGGLLGGGLGTVAGGLLPGKLGGLLDSVLKGGFGSMVGKLLKGGVGGSVGQLFSGKLSAITKLIPDVAGWLRNPAGALAGGVGKLLKGVGGPVTGIVELLRGGRGLLPGLIGKPLLGVVGKLLPGAGSAVPGLIAPLVTASAPLLGLVAGRRIRGSTLTGPGTWLREAIAAVRRMLGQQRRTPGGRVTLRPAPKQAAPQPLAPNATAPAQAPHFIYNRLDRDGRRVVDQGVLEQRMREAEARGHEVIRQQRGGQTLVYEAIPQHQPRVREQLLGINGVDVPVRNATADEAARLHATLKDLPAAHLREFVNRRSHITLVDWTGAPGENQRLLGGGSNISRERPEIGEAGPRIELTHSAMAKESYKFTVLHEIGHVAYEARLIPRTVEGTAEQYGHSQHQGPSELPAYAYARYFLTPGRLTENDRAALDQAVRAARQEPPTSGDER